MSLKPATARRLDSFFRSRGAILILALITLALAITGVYLLCNPTEPLLYSYNGDVGIAVNFLALAFAAATHNCLQERYRD